MSKIKGGCLCGSVQYSSDAEPVMTAVCHCENCQRQTGTAFSIIVGIPTAALSFASEETLAAFKDSGESGGAVNRRFCRNCGSPITSEVEVMPGVSFLKAGTLDDKSWLEPSAHIWCDSAQPWVAFEDESIMHGKGLG